MITITVLLVTQLLGLAFLAIYASRNPSWTEVRSGNSIFTPPDPIPFETSGPLTLVNFRWTTPVSALYPNKKTSTDCYIQQALDSWAMLRLGAELGPDMPTVSTLPAQRFKVLDEKSGFVGDAGVESMHGEVASRQLMLGGLERVRAGTMYSMTRVSK